MQLPRAPPSQADEYVPSLPRATKASIFWNGWPPHKAIGIETFFVYSKNNDDGSDALLKRLSEAGVIYWLKSVVADGTSPQFKAYNHALNVLPQILDYEWALFIDLDEFLVLNPDRFAGLTDYVAWQELRRASTPERSPTLERLNFTAILSMREALSLPSIGDTIYWII